MREGDLSAALLVQACEETDPDGRFLPLAERTRASRRAGEPPANADASGPQTQAWVLRRAAPLVALLESEYSAVGRARAGSSLRLPLAGVVAVGVLLGLGLEALGSARELNLLSVPVLGLLGWNLLVYASTALRRLWGGPLGIAVRWRRLALRWASRRVPGAPETTRWLTRALSRYGELWGDAAGGLLGARVARTLHLGAAATGVGVIARMYLSGLRKEYLATWESTLLDPGQVHALLAGVLAPAAWLLGAEVPGVAEVAAIERPAHGDAALWLHLWATTVGWVVVAPRLVLATASALRERRASARLGLDLRSPWILQQLAPTRGAETAVEVTPFSYRPSAASLERQRELCLELFGNRARLDFREPAAYGDDLPPAGFGGARERCRVVVFNLAQAPEQEVHGRIVEQLAHWAEDATGEGVARVLVLLDEEPHARRIRPEGGVHTAERLGQRQRAWERVVRSVGLGACRLPESGEVAAATLRDALAALWTPAAAAVAPAPGGGA